MRKIIPKLCRIILYISWYLALVYFDELSTRFKKHKVSFEEAKSVFEDVEALIIDDPEHSEQEERFIIMGFSSKARLLVVCHCYRANETVIRIISARKATERESMQYRAML